MERPAHPERVARALPAAEALHEEGDAARDRPREMNGREWEPGGSDGAFREGEPERLPVRNRLTVYYQPIFELASGRMFGAEALLRWFPAGGMPTLPPKESGLISSTSHWVLEKTCRQASDWRREYPGLPLIVFVNLSEAQLQSAKLSTVVGRALRRSGLEPDGLGLEVTETAALAADGSSVYFLGRLRRMGVSVAIDDFGTGRSSLSRLRFLPADYLKLDKTFVDGLESGSSRDKALVSAVIDLAHTFDTRVVAEGIESPEQLGMLRAMGCDLAQGYHLSAPMSAEEASALIARSAGENTGE